MKRLGLFALVAVCFACSGTAYGQTLKVLVTNDDGITAEGISALVSELIANPNLDVTVIAPATNQSGTGDNLTLPPNQIGVSAGTTAAGYGGKQVTGYPADTVMFGIREFLPAPPDIVVSGINFGQNITRDVAAELSGTVGAALTAGRLGIPGIAVSQGFGTPMDYTKAAKYVANVVEDMRTKPRLPKKMTSKSGRNQRIVLNINFPTCSAGTLRGVEVVPLAELTTVTEYALQSDNGTTKMYKAVVQSGNAFASDCTSTLEDPADDLEAMNNGFAAVTALNPDLTVDSKLSRFRFLKKIPFE